MAFMIISCYLYPLIFILHIAFRELRIYFFISIFFFSKTNKLSTKKKVAVIVFVVCGVPTYPFFDL